jgi:hypothetical protein
MVPPSVRKAALAKYKASPLFENGQDADYTQRLVTKKDVDTLRELIDMIYPASNYKPSQLKDTTDNLFEMGTVIRYHPRDHKLSKDQLLLAYVQREFRNSYKIFINEDVEDEAFDSMDLHEKGHVFFNHTQNIKVSMEQFKKELETIWDAKIAKYFNNDVINTSKSKIVKMLYMEFSNIAQDMEINSKLFDNGEWVRAKKTMGRSAMIVHYLALISKFDDLSGLLKDENDRKIKSKSYQKVLQNFLFMRDNIKERINGEEGDFQFCYPTNQGWPEKLDWMTYMILLIKNIDNTMEQVIKQIMSGLSQKGNGNGGSGPGGKTISQDVLDNYMDQQAGDKAAQSDANGNFLDDDDTEENGDGDGEDGGTGVANGRNMGGNSMGKGSGGTKCEFETCDTFDNFTKFLAKHCLGKKNRKWNSDVLYNSNRGKFASRVVVPRRHLTEKWMPTECNIIVDVSGSVPTDYVERVINSIVDTNSGIDLAHSHIIFCDENVVSDEIMSKRTKSVYAGGGTHIASGIKYVADKGYCKRATDKLFVISDFQDDLDSWVTAVKGVPGIHYAIGYNVTDEEECEQVLERRGGRSRDNSEFAKAWSAAFRTVFITERIRE